MAKDKKKKVKEFYNVQLRWKKPEDRKAIKALQAIAKKKGDEATETLRWVCIHCKSDAINKLKAIKELLRKS